MTNTDTTDTDGIWRDPHAYRRGHELVLPKVAMNIPEPGSHDNVGNYDDVIAHVKLFSPHSDWAWYITEMNPQSGDCFGLVKGWETELGSFDLDDLASATINGGPCAVERDLYWTPRPLRDIRAD